MTTNHLDELKKLRDEERDLEHPEGYGPCRTPAQIAALDYILKREESLANAEGHAKVLALESKWIDEREYHSSKVELRPAMEAGALALTERPALMAELTTACTALAEKEDDVTRLSAEVESYRTVANAAAKVMQELLDENTRLRAECERLLSCVNEAEIGWATDNTEKDDEIERLRAENETIKSKLPSTRQLCNEAYEGDPTLNTWGNQFRR